jgi:hypothetical protein
MHNSLWCRTAQSAGVAVRSAGRPGRGSTAYGPSEFPTVCVVHHGEAEASARQSERTTTHGADSAGGTALWSARARVSKSLHLFLFRLPLFKNMKLKFLV